MTLRPAPKCPPTCEKTRKIWYETDVKDDLMIPKLADILEVMRLMGRPIRHLWSDACEQSVRTTGRHEFPCEGAPVERWIVMTKARDFRLDTRCELHAAWNDPVKIRGDPDVEAAVPISEDDLTVIRVMVS